MESISRAWRSVDQQQRTDRSNLHNLRGQVVQQLVRAKVGHARAQRCERDCLDLVGGAPFASFGEFTDSPRPGKMGSDFVYLRNSVTLRRDRLEEPEVATFGAVGQVDHVPQFATRCTGAIAIRLVDNKDVADLEDARLRRLDSVTHPWSEQYEDGVGYANNFDLRLADPNGLWENDDVTTRRVQDPQRLWC